MLGGEGSQPHGEAREIPMGNLFQPLIGPATGPATCPLAGSVLLPLRLGFQGLDLVPEVGCALVVLFPYGGLELPLESLHAVEALGLGFRQPG